MKVAQDSKYKLIFSVFTHPQLGVMIHPYVVAYTSHQTLSLTYQKVFSGNASYYTRLSSDQLAQIATLDDVMVENIVRKFSPKQKIRPKEFFQKHLSKEILKNEIRPFIESKILNLLALLNSASDRIYIADDINPAAIPIRILPSIVPIKKRCGKIALI